MSTETQGTTEQQASAQADASFQSLLASWKAVFESFKLKLHSHTDLVSADLRLSVKALAVAAMAILTFVGVALVLWSSLLIAMTFGLLTLGVHWGLCTLIVVLLNIGVLIMTKRILSDAIKSISLQASVEALSSSQKSE